VPGKWQLNSPADKYASEHSTETDQKERNFLSKLTTQQKDILVKIIKVGLLGDSVSPEFHFLTIQTNSGCTIH
jgi:hypothetical protein